VYGFSAGLDLRNIIGCNLSLLGLGEFDVQFNFGGSGIRFCIQGRICLLENGRPISAWDDQTKWTSLSFQKLLNVTVKSYSVSNDRLLEINFENGLTLQLHDDSEQYEAMQIYFDDKTKDTIII
jgi:hypothetical protein